MSTHRAPHEAPDPASTYNWPDIVRRAGAPSADDDTLFPVGASPATLVKLGEHVYSPRIATDALRWAGQLLDHFDRATPAQHDELALVVPLVRVTVRDVDALNTLFAKFTAQRAHGDAAHAHDVAAADRAHADAANARNALEATLRTAARYDAASVSLEQVRAARPGAESRSPVGSSLEALVVLAKSVVAHPRTTAAKQLRAAGYTDAKLGALAQLATDTVASETRASGARAGGAVTQADVDRADGVCLTHMTALYEIVNAAHDRDPSVPHLVPIATRTFFHQTTHRQQPEAPATPTTPAAT